MEADAIDIEWIKLYDMAIAKDKMQLARIKKEMRRDIVKGNPIYVNHQRLIPQSHLIDEGHEVNSHDPHQWQPILNSCNLGATNQRTLDGLENVGQVDESALDTSYPKSNYIYDPDRVTANESPIHVMYALLEKRCTLVTASTLPQPIECRAFQPKYG
ncbi:hypothetical protein U1Q18_010902 [Sarracenia purpurea var. burkii]